MKKVCIIILAVCISLGYTYQLGNIIGGVISKASGDELLSTAKAGKPFGTIESIINQRINQIAEVKNEPIEGIVGVDCEVTPDGIIKTNDDAVIELVTFAGCGGGNHYETYLIVASSIRGIIDVLQVGEDHTFSAEFIKISGQIIEVHGHLFLPTDAHCCPTGTKKYEYAVIKNHIVLIKE